MATDHSRNLMRSVRRGSVPTHAMPAGPAPSGVFTESEGPVDGRMMSLGATDDASLSTTVTAADMFNQFFGGGAGLGGGDLGEMLDAGSQVAPAIPVSEQGAKPAAEALAAPPVSRSARFRGAGVAATAPALPDAEPSASTGAAPKGAAELDTLMSDAAPAAPVSRAERFRAAGVGVAPATSAEEAPAAEQPAEERPWRRFVDKSTSREATSLKQNMAAAKVLTPLVAAVSFAPGSDSPGAKKAKALSEMLVGVHRVARETAETISTQVGQDVPSWMVTQLMQGLSTSIAGRWQRGEGADIEALASNMRQIFRADSAELIDLVRGASEDAYVEVNHPDIARFRISVSSANAAWTIYDWVTNPKLMLNANGEAPSRFFTYGVSVHDLVNKLLTRTVNECRGLVAQVESADLRTAHMQSAIGRMANLMGSEYVTQTCRVMDWVGDPSQSEEVYKERYASAERELETRLLPQIFEYARVNFLRIEQGAFRAIEELYEQSKSPEATSSGSPDRPAVQ